VLDRVGNLHLLPNNAGLIPRDKYDVVKKPFFRGTSGTLKTARVKKTKSEKWVALKPVAKTLSLSRLNAFVNEAGMLAGLDHPNIIKLHEAFEDHRQVYVALELCSGGDLFDTIIEQSSFGEADASFVMLQILRAVFYLHSQCIAHRDLRPENFLFMDANAEIVHNTLKLVDAKNAKRFTKHGPVTAHMKTRVGTPLYMAPEVHNGRYTEKCDMWSCGVLLYILLSGMPPFEGDDDAAIVHNSKKCEISFDLPEFSKVNSHAKDLILSLCTLNYWKRLSAQDALSNPWVQQPDSVISPESIVSGDTFMKRLQGFSSVSKFKMKAMQVIAHRLDDDSIAKMKASFHELDKDGDGNITLEELEEAVAKIGISDCPDITAIFQKLDTDGNGLISYTEFLASMIDTKSIITEDTCWQAFQIFDKDGSGTISLDEFIQMMQEKHDDLSKVSNVATDDLINAFNEADTDGSREISFDEFLDMMRGNN